MLEREKLIFKDETLAQHLRQAHDLGITHIPNFLGLESVSSLQKLFSGVEYDLSARTYPDGVREHVFSPRELPTETTKTLKQFGNNIKEVLQQHASEFPALSTWQPRQHNILMYDEDSFMTSHKDGYKDDFLGVIFLLSIQGEAYLKARNTKYAAPFATYLTCPGDAVILRAKGLNQSISPRRHAGIFHSVEGALTGEPRISLGYRD